VPAACKPEHVFAFDTGPANMLIDALVQHFTQGNQRYDKNAALATQGRANPALVNELMKDPYLRQGPPKTTGREYYGRVYVKNLLAAARKYKAQPNDTIRAATIFTALTIVDALNRFVLPKHKIAQLIVSGGGAKNPLILAQLSAALNGPVAADFRSLPATPQARTISTSSKIEVLLSSELNVPTEAKEAFAFALMAYETFHHRPSNLPSATGAKGPAILGKISYAPPR
jgi:anhydro-N-acetylmuramic acid kinase